MGLGVVVPFVAVVVGVFDDVEVLAPLGCGVLDAEAEEDWEARARSHTRNFFSIPPVASRDGDGEEGNATARTMWLC